MILTRVKFVHPRQIGHLRMYTIPALSRSVPGSLAQQSVAWAQQSGDLTRL
jgi:hypothetical protein